MVQGAAGKEGILKLCAENAEAIGLREKLWTKLKDRPPPTEKLAWKPDIETFFQLYFIEDMELDELADTFRVSRSTIKGYIREHGLYKRVPLDLPFRGTQRDREYIVGLRLADLYVWPATVGVRVLLTTTRPAMEHLYKDIAGDYAPIHRNPIPPSKWSTKRIYGWGIYAHLSKHFDFLLPKQIPQKPTIDNIAGLVDGDGSTRISPSEGKYLSYEVVFYNQRQELVDTYYDSLLDLGISANPPRERRREDGRIELTVSVTGKDDVIELLHKLELRHPDKCRWKQLILETTNNDPSEVIKKSEMLRREIRQATSDYCKAAEEEYRRRHRDKLPPPFPFPQYRVLLYRYIIES